MSGGGGSGNDFPGRRRRKILITGYDSSSSSSEVITEKMENNFIVFFFGGGEIRVSRMIKHFGPPAESPSPSDLWRNKVIVIFKLDYMGNKGERTERKWMREPSSDQSGPIRLRRRRFLSVRQFFYSKIGNCFSLRFEGNGKSRPYVRTSKD